MDSDLFQEIEALKNLRVNGLKEKYREVFGEESRSNNKQFLFRRIAWRMQAIKEGDLSERARRRAEELARDADLRILAPESFSLGNSGSGETIVKSFFISHDRRLPMPGTILARFQVADQYYFSWKSKFQWRALRGGARAYCEPGNLASCSATLPPER